MGTRTTRIRRTNADFNLLDADDTDDADFKAALYIPAYHTEGKKESASSVSSVSERLLARRRRTLLQRYAGKLSFISRLAALAYVPSYFLSITKRVQCRMISPKINIKAKAEFNF